MTRQQGHRAPPQKRQSRNRKLAALADRHALYERAVQDPKTDAKMLERLYRRYRKQSPRLLREDFCGTATMSAHWVQGSPDRRAYGIDLDQPTLDWGRAHSMKIGKKDVADHVSLIHANVLDGEGPRTDITCALNFSYNCLLERRLILEYFKVARRGLKRDGVFIMDVFGGTEVHGADENTHDYEDFVYRWEQEFFDPLTHKMRCHIHFDFPDGSKMSPAFSYDWRLWTPPELNDLLTEAGFSTVHWLWERIDGEGEGTGAFFEPKRVENQESWWTYVVAER